MPDPVNSQRPAGALCSYSGYLTGFTLDPELVASLRTTAQRIGINLDVERNFIELSFVGRDSNDFVIAFLSELARAIGDADGEIRCEITIDELDPLFEFYRVSEGKLLRQKCRKSRRVHA